MEEIVSLIYNGCKLARDLEFNLPNIANQPHILWNNCDEIIRIFTETKDGINARFEGEAMQQQWVRYDDGDHEQEAAGHASMERIRDIERWTGDHGDHQVATTESAAGRSGPKFQRMRRRKDDGDRRTVRVPAPQMGNTEIPPGDGFIWRKYGQKEILGFRFPRGYYRCTHQKLYHCPAKKQVQRLSDDPFTFEVIYRSDHTCTVSSTAPAAASILPAAADQNAEASRTNFLQHATIPTRSSQLLFNTSSSSAASPSHWLSMEIQTQSADVIDSTTTHHYHHHHHHHQSNPFVNMNMFSSSSGVAQGPSTSPFGREVGYDHSSYETLTDFVNVMFNPGNSSNSNMDLIFSEEHKWDDNC